MDTRIRRERLQRRIAILFISLVVVGAVVRLVAAARTAPTTRTAGARAVGQVPAARTAPTTRTAGAQAVGQVPASLAATESATEDVIALALRHERAKVVTRTAALRGAARARSAAALRRAGVPTREFSRFQRRERRVVALAPRAPFVRVSLAVNALAALLPTFYARFGDLPLAAVLTLRSLDREAQLRSLAGDQAAAGAAAAALARAWAELRPVVAPVDRSLAARYAAHAVAMRRLARDGTPPALRHEAVRGVHLTDALETVLAR